MKQASFTHGDLDSLVESYLREPGGPRADQLLEELLAGTQALVRPIVASRLGRSVSSSQDVGDVCGNASVDLLEKIESLRCGAASPLESFSRYAAVVAYHACHDYFRAKSPHRHRLKNRLRYLLKPQNGFGLWESLRGTWICGLAHWTGQDANVARGLSVPSGAASLTPPELLSAIFREAGGPVEFDALVDLAADVWSVEDITAPLEEHHLRTGSAPLSQEVAVTERLRQMWRELLRLPRPQRVSLLLNLRAPNEECALDLFPLSGIASIGQIASALEIPAEDLAAMWNQLPIDDLTIGALLGLTRQQVINLRMSARKRLGRSVAATKGEWK